MVQLKRATFSESDEAEKRAKPLTLTERLRQRLQARRLERLLSEMDRELGPVPAEVVARVRRSWRED